jgi:uncharacterized damage-inducible protein DinB
MAHKEARNVNQQRCIRTDRGDFQTQRRPNVGSLNGLSSEQLWHRPTGQNNPMLWIAGHITQTRAVILALTGNPFNTGWSDLFARGSALGDQKTYPSITEIHRLLGQVGEKLYTTLESRDEEQLARPFSGIELPHVKTAADQLALFVFHDSYHVGQLAYIRKGLGFPAIAG